MARLEVIAPNRWKQPFVDRMRDYRLWQIPTAVINACSIQDKTRRRIRVTFAAEHEIDVEDLFTVTSGRELRFPAALQQRVRPVIQRNPLEFFVAEILDGVFTAADSPGGDAPTSAARTVAVRIGQQQFREKLWSLWRGCSVTNAPTKDLLRASHIKPWRLATDQERLDPNNGLLLTPDLDALFDKGYISFDKQGALIVSHKHPHLLKEYALLALRLRIVTSELQEYLAFHRSEVFKE